MPCWDGGAAQQPEGEREMQSWHEDEEGADAWKGGEAPDQGDEWKEADWHDGPEYRAWKRKRDEEGG